MERSHSNFCDIFPTRAYFYPRTSRHLSIVDAMLTSHAQLRALAEPLLWKRKKRVKTDGVGEEEDERWAPIEVVCSWIWVCSSGA